MAVEAIRGSLTAAEIAKKFDVHPNLVANWKRSALEQLPANFVRPAAFKQESDAEKDALQQQIGKLKVELDFLKRRTGSHD